MIKDCFFHIVAYNSVLLSNIPNNMYDFAASCDEGYSNTKCDILGKDIRLLKETVDDGYIFLYTLDHNVTRKMLHHYFDAIRLMHNSYKKKLTEITDSASNNLRRLQHNVTNYNASIRDELSEIVPFDDVKHEWTNILSKTESIVEDNPRRAALALLKILKNNTLIKAELTVYDLIAEPNPRLEIYPHLIHKVVKLSFQPYFLEFLEYDIHLNWGECFDKVLIDYPSISVALGHIWNNAIKYAKKSSTISIGFETNYKSVSILIGMQSIAIEEAEKERVYELGYSSRWAKALNKEGHGIGMYYIKLLIEMNDGMFSFHSNGPQVYHEGIPYTYKQLKIVLPKA